MFRKKIIIEFSNEWLIKPMRLTIVVGALRKSDLIKCANRIKVDNR